MDSDGDGVPDHLDDDDDNDGIPDELGKSNCSSYQNQCKFILLLTGCPLPPFFADLDDDGDGIPDEADSK